MKKLEEKLKNLCSRVAFASKKGNDFDGFMNNEIAEIVKYMTQSHDDAYDKGYQDGVFSAENDCLE